MADINLLPQGYGPDPAVAKLSSKIVRAVVVEFVVFIVVGVLGIGIYFLYSNKIVESAANLQSFKSSISTLEATEQRLFLLKDRIDKAAIVLDADTSVDEVTEFESANSEFSSGASLDKVTFIDGKIEAVYVLTDSSQLVDMLLLLKSSQRFSRIELINLSFAADKGYTVSLSLSK